MTVKDTVFGGLILGLGLALKNLFDENADKYDVLFSRMMPSNEQTSDTIFEQYTYAISQASNIQVWMWTLGVQERAEWLFHVFRPSGLLHHLYEHSFGGKEQKKREFAYPLGDTLVMIILQVTARLLAAQAVIMINSTIYKKDDKTFAELFADFIEPKNYANLDDDKAAEIAKLLNATDAIPGHRFLEDANGVHLSRTIVENYESNTPWPWNQQLRLIDNYPGTSHSVYVLTQILIPLITFYLWWTKFNTQTVFNSLNWQQSCKRNNGSTHSYYCKWDVDPNQPTNHGCTSLACLAHSPDVSYVTGMFNAEITDHDKNVSGNCKWHTLEGGGVVYCQKDHLKTFPGAKSNASKYKKLLFCEGKVTMPSGAGEPTEPDEILYRNWLESPARSEFWFYPPAYGFGFVAEELRRYSAEDYITKLRDLCRDGTRRPVRYVNVDRVYTAFMKREGKAETPAKEEKKTPANQSASATKSAAAPQTPATKNLVDKPARRRVKQKPGQYTVKIGPDGNEYTWTGFNRLHDRRHYTKPQTDTAWENAEKAAFFSDDEDVVVTY